jgi:cyclopropane fatty-acyl-phospholipid synthase-like methyltransferase
MNIFDFFTIVERDHTYQNPTSIEKLDLLIEYCGIGDGDRVLDIGCGKGWLLRRLAERYAVQAEGIEVNRPFVEEGQAEIDRSRLKGEVRYHHIDARDFSGEKGVYDVGLCIGASFAIGTFEEALAWLQPYVRPGGVMAFGDVYARSRSLPSQSAEEFSGGPIRTLSDTAERMNRDGLSLIGLIDSSPSDWDRYESTHWRVAEEWMREHPDHPEFEEFRRQSEEFKLKHLRFDRESLGWALFVSRVS